MIHETAMISRAVKIGKNVKIWAWVQIGANVVIGDNCVVSKGVYIQDDVVIGNNVKIGNNVSIFKGVTIEDDVLIGPHVCFTNDKFPRAVNCDGTLKCHDDWKLINTLVKTGVSIGANSTIVCGIILKEYSMIGAGSVVVKDVPGHSLVYGNPATFKKYLYKVLDSLSSGVDIVDDHKREDS